MSNQWQNNQFGQGPASQAGQVKMFDATQFQAVAAHVGGDQPGKSVPQLGDQAPVALPAQQITSEQPAHSSWNSWGTWDWGVEKNSPVPGVKQQQDLGTQQPYLFAAQNKHAFSDEPAAGSQHFGGGQGSSIWNQGWNGGDLYSQPQQACPVEPSESYNQGQGQQPQHNYSGDAFAQGQQPQNNYSGDAFAQGQQPQNNYSGDAFAQGQQPQHNYSGDAFAQGQQPQHNYSGDAFAQGQQPQHNYSGDAFAQGQQPNYSGDAFGQGQDGATESGSQYEEDQQRQQQYFTQFYDDHQQQQPGIQEQSYSSQYRDHKQYQGHMQPFYGHAYDPSGWTTTANEEEQWVNDFQGHQHLADQVDAEDVVASEQQLSGSQNSTAENTPQTTADSSANHNVLIGPCLEVYSNDGDDDGTVSEYFGRDGDGDGDVQLDSKKPSHGGGGNGQEISSGLNQFLMVASTLHRSNSEISNASLSTLNLSSGEEDDGREQLHNVQKLVKRMEELDRARRKGEEENLSTDNSLTVGQPYVNADVHHDSSVKHEQKEHRGDYSGFGSSVYNHSSPQLNLPLEGNKRPSSPGGSQPGSAESGGSSGLTDWEIVPPSISTVSHNGNNFFQSNVNFSDKPDGDVGMSLGIKNSDHQNKSAHLSEPVTSSSTADVQNIPYSFQNLDPSCHNTPLTLSDLGPPQHDTRERSGSPFVPAFTDNRQEELLPPVSQTSPFTVSAVSPSKSSDSAELNVQTSDGAADALKIGVKNTAQTSIPEFTNQASLANKQMSKLKDANPVEEVTARYSHKSSESQRSSGGAAVSKHKPSMEDGNCDSRRDSDHSINSTDTSSGRGKYLGESPARSSSRNSEEISASGQQRQHHSAFHLVSRPQRTVVSPATTLWDNTDKLASNILLAPAMPLIIPSLRSFPSPSSAAAKSVETAALGKMPEHEKTVDKSRVKGQNSSADVSMDSRGKRDEQNNGERREKDKNRSFDSLDEIDAIVEGQRNRSYHSQRNNTREPRYGQDSDRRDSGRQDSDRTSSRTDRPGSRNDHSGHYHYDRPSSRTDGYSRDDNYHRRRGYYRDYVDTSFDERYDRPRSRQDESQGSRPSSRATQEVDQPRSRTNYERDRDYYYRDRHRGYSYDSYDRGVDYYDTRERYYRYYRDKEARYTRGYYEEYYGVKHADYYYKQQQLQHQQQQQQQHGGRLSSQGSERSSSQGQSRGSTPATAPSPGIPPPSGTTPSSGPDYCDNRGSRPPSRSDYSRDYYSRGYPYEGYGGYYDGYGYDPYIYGYGYPAYDEYNRAYDHGRMTPPKYSYPHVRACFGPGGQLIKVLPNYPADGQPAIVEVQDVQTVLESCPEAEELKQFPGPLTRAGTHKKDVLLFCQRRSRECSGDINMVDRESAQLIWRYLGLLIKQNGAVVGTDLSDLLLEGHEPSTHEYTVHGVKISQSPEALDKIPEGSYDESNSARASPAVRVTSDRTVINSADGEREKWVDRFRHLLLYGRRKDALECAMKHDLWGHAFFLASKMDARTHANVMTRFANGAIRMNDPLQTLYQLMSGRQPAAVTCVVDERWGDWRPHLAMILSNQTSRQDLDRRSITVLGDTLAAKGYLHASHFCYLMAQVNFGNYLRKTSKIVLIGSSHNRSTICHQNTGWCMKIVTHLQTGDVHLVGCLRTRHRVSLHGEVVHATDGLPLETFASNDAVQCTEVYEYAQSLGNPAFFLPHFQVFKYLYACRLADYGMASEALQYCEVIASNILQNPTWFHAPFVKLVFQLSSKLRFADPQRQISGEDAEDPPWLQQLEKVCDAYDDGSIQPLSGTATPAGFPGTTASSESGDFSSYGYGYTGDATATPATSGTPGLDVYGRQQQHGQADTTGYHSGHDIGAITGQVQSLNITSTDQYQQQEHQNYTQQQQYDYTLWQQQQLGYQYLEYGDHQQQHHNVEQTASHQQYSHQQQQQQQEGAPYQHSTAAAYAGTIPDLGDGGRGQPAGTVSNMRDVHHGLDAGSASNIGDVGHNHTSSSSAYNDDISYLGGEQLDSSSTSTNLSSHFASKSFSNYGAEHSSLSHRASLSTSGADDVEDDDGDDVTEDEDATGGPRHGFDYFGNVGGQKVVVPPHRYRNTSGSSGGSTRRRRTLSGSSTGSVKAAPHKPSPPKNQQQPAGVQGSDKIPKAGQQDNGGSWLGGFLNKFKVKGKNEMILPDDKNPSIIWDPVKKKWINADGTEEESTPAAPPPKDTDLLGKPVPTASTATGQLPPSGPPGGNRFSLRAKGARSQYVDVNNPKPVSVPPNLFNVMPEPASANGTSDVATPQLFMPGSGSAAGAATDVNNSNINNSLLSVPDSSEQLSRSSSVSSLSQEVQQFMAEPHADKAGAPASVTAAPKMPMLFNPADMKSGSAGTNQATSASGQGSRFGQRRAYPK